MSDVVSKEYPRKGRVGLYFCHLMQRADLIENHSDCTGKEELRKDLGIVTYLSPTGHEAWLCPGEARIWSRGERPDTLQLNL